MSHGNARLTPAGRLLLVQRVAAGELQAEATRQMRLSRATMAKWWGRWVEHGDAGLTDRSSQPAAVAAAHRRGDRGADLPAAAQHQARSGVPVGAHRGAGLDDLAGAAPPRAEPPRPPRPPHRTHNPPLRESGPGRAGSPRTSKKSRVLRRVRQPDRSGGALAEAGVP